MDELNRDEAIWRHLEENFSCKICSGVLIAAKGVNCGHKFCTYCLDLLQTTTKNCPQCATPITTVIKAQDIDKEIDRLFDSCSPELQSSHESAKRLRTEKIQERSKQFKEIRKNLPHGSPAMAKSARNLDDICTSLASNIASSMTSSSSLKSTQPIPPQFREPYGKTRRNGCSPLVVPRPKSKAGIRGNEISKLFGSNDDGESEMLAIRNKVAGIDLVKVEALFNMYDVFLKSEPGQGGSGDLTEALVNPAMVHHPPPPEEVPNESSEILRIKKKHKQEVESLLKEAEGAIELDEFVKKWSEELRKVVNGDDSGDKINKPNDCMEISTIPDGAGISEDVDSEEERWKASEELIRRFRESKHPSRPRLPKDRMKLKKDLPLVFEGMNLQEDFLTSPDANSNITNQTDYDLELEELSLSNSKNTNKESSRKINLPEMGETIVDENFAFWKKINDCKEALNKLKDNQLTTPETVRNLLQTQECKTSRVPVSSRINLPLPIETSSSTPRLLGSRVPMPLDPLVTPTPRRPPTTAIKATTFANARPSTATASSKIIPTLPPISNTARGKARPTTAILKKRPPFQ